MRKLILSVLLVCSSMSISAQSFDWGVKVNVGSPNVSLDDLKNLDKSGHNVGDLLEVKDATLNWQLGLFARLKLLGFYIQPEAMFSNSKSELKYNDVIGEVKINKVDVPVMLGKRFLKIFRVNAGPVFSLKLSQDIKGIKNAADEISANYKNATVGLQYGVGLDISMISVDLRVEKGLQSISDEFKIAGRTFSADQRLDQVMLAIGIRF
ncbi:MAG: porin family protein [Flavobacteriales bacterium]|nr:porin family protein [Flavobacteriales bacterium]